MSFNIFVLDAKPELAARYHCDAHIKGMVGLYMQLLVNAHHFVDGLIGNNWPQGQVMDHPVSRWACMNRANYRWVHGLFEGLAGEHEHRFNKPEYYWSQIGEALRQPPNKIGMAKCCTRQMRCFMTPRCFAGVEQFIVNVPRGEQGEHIDHLSTVGEAVRSYRRYYSSLMDEGLAWTKRDVPGWLHH